MPAARKSATRRGIVWFRRDLRVADNRALHRAADECDEILPLFVIDDAVWDASANRRWFAAGCLRELDAALGGDAPGAAIGDPAAAVDGAEVAAGGQVVRPQVEIDAQRLQHAAPHRVGERVVAEQAEVAGPAAGGDSGRDVAQGAMRAVCSGHDGALKKPAGRPGGASRRRWINPAG